MTKQHDILYDSLQSIVYDVAQMADRLGITQEHLLDLIGAGDMSYSWRRDEAYEFSNLAIAANVLRLPWLNTEIYQCAKDFVVNGNSASYQTIEADKPGVMFMWGEHQRFIPFDKMTWDPQRGFGSVFNNVREFNYDRLIHLPVKLVMQGWVQRDGQPAESPEVSLPAGHLFDGTILIDHETAEELSKAEAAGYRPTFVLTRI